MKQDPRFDIHVNAYVQARTEKKRRKLSLNTPLKGQVADVTLKGFEYYLFISIDIEYKKNAFFPRMLLQTCIDNNTRIITHPDIAFANQLFLLQDDIEMN